jgi:uncharacterized protein YjbI with pentapeptide repeats
VTPGPSKRPEPPTSIALPALVPWLVGAALRGHEDYEATDFSGPDLARTEATGATFLACRFERCGLDEASLRHSRFSECLVSEPHASSLDVADSTWRDTLVTSPRIGALLAVGTSWSGVRVRGGKIDLLDLNGAKLADVVIEGTVIEELDLGTAQARWTRLVGCDIGVLDVTGARLTEVDLSGSTIREVRGIEGLRGATISPSQLLELAPALAAHVGLKVRADQSRKQEDDR